MELNSLAKLKGWHTIVVTGDIDINISASVQEIINESHFACSTVFTEYDTHLARELELIASKCYWDDVILMAIEGNHNGKSWSVCFDSVDSVETTGLEIQSEIENDSNRESINSSE